MISKTYRQKYAHQCSIRRLYTCFLSIFILIACGSSPETRENPGDFDDPRQQVSGSLTEEIRSLTETGILSSMLQALELIRSRNLAGAEFGRVMNGINTLLIRLVYPDSLVRLPILDLPQTHNYTRIIREAERGVYQQPHENSIDFFEHILPFLAVTENVTNLTELFPAIFDDLKKAERIRPTSIFPAFFQGLLHERLTNLSEAERFFRQAYSISEEFYPALIGIARVRRLSGDLTEAVRLFSDLTIRYPDSLEIKKELTLSLFENRAWQRALPIIDEVLLAEPRNGDFILMKAFILIEQGNHSQANVLLDGYAAINPNNRMYLFLRARIQFEGNRNRDSALNYLRSILRSNPDDEEALGFAATLLLESPRPADHAEGRELLERMRRISGSSIDVLSLNMRDAIMRESWQEAQGFHTRILAVRRTVQDLIDGYHIERNLGNNVRALSFAQELYGRDTSNSEYIVIYISALIDNNRRDEASRLLDSNINVTGRGPLLSRFYFLRSRLQTNEDAALSDLRASLFEDPRNLDALIAIFQIYHRRREERRAVHYLRQALAIAPNHPLLQRFEREYAALLGRN